MQTRYLPKLPALIKRLSTPDLQANKAVERCKLIRDDFSTSKVDVVDKRNKILMCSTTLLKIETVLSFETLVPVYQTIRGPLL